MEHTQANPSLTLDEVHNHFQQWRDTRKHQTERIPDNLLAEARSLLDKYPLSNILRKLRLNRHRLLSAESLPSTSINVRSSTFNTSSPFVPIPWPEPEVTAPCLEIKHPNGMTLCLQDCTKDLLKQMVSTFMGQVSCSK